MDKLPQRHGFRRSREVALRPCSLAVFLLTAARTPTPGESMRSKATRLVETLSSNATWTPPDALKALSENFESFQPTFAGNMSWTDWLLTYPEEALTWAFVIFLALCLLRQAVTGESDSVGTRQEIATKRDEAHKAIHQLVSTMEEQLQGIVEGSVLLAEVNFNDKKKDFQRFLRFFREQSEQRDNGLLLESFQHFARHWLGVFQECSLDPLHCKVHSVTEEELAACGTPAETATLVLERLERIELGFASSKLQDLTEMKSLATAGASQLSSRAWLTRKNVLTLLALAVGFGIFLLDVHRRRYYSLVALLAALLSPVVVRRFDDPLSMLEEELEQLEEQMGETKERARKVRVFYGKVQQVSCLWRHRTVPHLEILKEVHNALAHIGDDSAVDFLERTCKTLDQVNKALGPLEIWFGECALGESMLMLVAQQLDDQSVASRMATCRMMEKKLGDWAKKSKSFACGDCGKDFKKGGVIITRRHHCRCCGGLFCGACCNKEMKIPRMGYEGAVKVCNACASQLKAELREQRRKRQTELPLPRVLQVVHPAAFLHVNVLRAFDLANSDSGLLGDLSDPYVTLTLNDEVVRTEVKLNDVNPVFNQSFFFTVRSNDHLLFIKVWDSNETRRDTPLGSLDLKFRSLEPNKWIVLRRPLEEASQGALEIEARFSEDAWHLI